MAESSSGVSIMCVCLIKLRSKQVGKQQKDFPCYFATGLIVVNMKQSQYSMLKSM